MVSALQLQADGTLLQESIGIIRNFESFVLSEVLVNATWQNKAYSNKIAVAKKTVSSAPDQKTCPCTIDSDPTVFMQWRTEPGYILCLLTL